METQLKKATLPRSANLVIQAMQEENGVHVETRGRRECLWKHNKKLQTFSRDPAGENVPTQS